MDLDDLKNKWLFVGYSAKRDGTENNEYRDKINTKRVFAGAKGIGRFSCDKLGKTLSLTTKKLAPSSKVENLKVNWENFEQDAKQEFINIDVEHNVVASIGYSLEHGTVLEISNLRETWDRAKKLSLKHSLEKLINPIQENDVDNFSIEIISQEDLALDNSQQDARDRVNGAVRNFIFEHLEIKTTQIITEIKPDSNVIVTTLKDRGRDIYTLTEKSPYTISGVKIILFQLNRSAKISFTGMMGLQPLKYGSVFMYKNGFRIYPFGEEGEDILQIDHRKQQGYNRFLGTRDLIGRIEINGNNPGFRETTSRGDGLEKNESFFQLFEFFREKALKRLEAYVVDIIKWGDTSKDSSTGEEIAALTPEDVKEEIIRIISNLTKATDVLDIKYDDRFLNIIESSQEESVSQIVKNFTRIAEETKNEKFVKLAKKAERHVKDLIAAKEQAEHENEQSKQKLARKTKQNLFLMSVQTLDKDRIIDFHHDISLQASTIQNWLETLAESVNAGRIDIDLLKRVIEVISRANNKILAISRFATKANFNTKGNKITADIISFIQQYTVGIFKDFYPNMKLHFSNKEDKSFSLKFKPLEISVLIDNIINNAQKADARNFYITVTGDDRDTVSLSFANDGKKLSSEIDNANDVFEKGFTTTNGAGLGLYFVASIVTEELKGTISVNSNYAKGFELIVRLVK